MRLLKKRDLFVKKRSLPNSQRYYCNKLFRGNNQTIIAMGGKLNGH